MSMKHKNQLVELLGELKSAHLRVRTAVSSNDFAPRPKHFLWRQEGVWASSL
jgi:hypothetical protein